MQLSGAKGLGLVAWREEPGRKVLFKENGSRCWTNIRNVSSLQKEPEACARS